MLAAYQRRLAEQGIDGPLFNDYFVELRAGLYGYTYLKGSDSGPQRPGAQ